MCVWGHLGTWTFFILIHTEKENYPLSPIVGSSSKGKGPFRMVPRGITVQPEQSRIRTHTRWHAILMLYSPGHNVQMALSCYFYTNSVESSMLVTWQVKFKLHIDIIPISYLMTIWSYICTYHQKYFCVIHFIFL